MSNYVPVLKFTCTHFIYYYLIKMRIFIASLMAFAMAKDMYSHAEIQINEGHVLGTELKEWLSSSKEDDMKTT